MSTTIRDVALAAGVSVTTASRVLSDSNHPVAAEVRQRVHQIALDLGYTPNAFARSLSRREFRLIGLLIPDVRDPYFVEIARGVEDVANQLGYMVILCDTDRNPEKERRYVRELRAMRAGIVLTGGAVNRDAHLQEIASHPAPIVVIGRHDIPYSAVEIDNVQGAIDATSHLIAMGRRRIAFIGGPPTSTTAADRLRGFRRAMADHQIDVDDALVVDTDFTVEAAEARTGQILESGRPLDAIFAASDSLAIGAMLEAKRRGLSIPTDIAIAGFNDIATARQVDPPLTTIHLPLREIGRVAAELLLEQARAGHAERRTVIVRGDLVIRGSTAAPQHGLEPGKTRGPRRQS